VGSGRARCEGVDTSQLDDVALPVAVVADGRDTCHAVVESQLYTDFILLAVRGFVCLALFKHRAVQVAALDDSWSKKEIRVLPVICRRAPKRLCDARLALNSQK